MTIRPSSSTGVLFALVHKDTVPLSVAVVTHGEDAVSTFKLPKLYRSRVSQAQTNKIKSLLSVSAEPASVFGRRLCGDAGHTHALLSWSADRAAERDCHGHADNSQLLQCHIRQVGRAAEGFGAPQRNNAERRADVHRWNTRLVQMKVNHLVERLCNHALCTHERGKGNLHTVILEIYF